MTNFKLATKEDGQAINHMLIVQHLESGDYDFSEHQTVDAAVEAAMAEVPESTKSGYEDNGQDLRAEIESTIEWYWPDEALKAAEEGYGWPVALGFVEEDEE